MVVYGGGTIHSPGFRFAMLKGWKWDNVFHHIFSSSQTQDYVLNEDLWNFDNK